MEYLLVDDHSAPPEACERMPAMKASTTNFVHCKFASLKLLSTAYTLKTIPLGCVRIEEEFEELLGKGNKQPAVELWSPGVRNYCGFK
jgi:hypothetical protein